MPSALILAAAVLLGVSLAGFGQALLRWRRQRQMAGRYTVIWTSVGDPGLHFSAVKECRSADQAVRSAFVKFRGAGQGVAVPGDYRDLHYSVRSKS